MPGQLNVSLVLKASESGFKSTLDDAERELGQLDKSADRVGRSIKKSLEQATGGSQLRSRLTGWRNQWNRASGSIKQGIGNIGLQAQDIALQLQAGTSPFTVALQQGSQIISAFGPQGAIVAAIGAGVLIGINSLVNLSEDGFAVAERAVKDLDAALAEANRTLGEGAVEADKIVESYNGLTDISQALGAVKIREDLIDTRRETEGAREAVRGLIEQIEFASGLRANLGLSSTGRAGVLGGLGGQLTLAEAEGLQSAIARFRSGAMSEVELIGEVQRVLAGASEAAREFTRELIEVADRAETGQRSLVELGKAGNSVAELAAQGGVHLGKLDAAVDKNTQTVKTNEGMWAGWYDALIGQSYIPDMVTQSEIWFDRLGNHMTSTTREATDGVADAFVGLDRQVSGTLARMITSNKLALQDFADFGLDIANQILTSIIQIGIQSGLNYALSPGAGAGAGLGGAGGAGMSSGQAMTSSGVLHAGGIVGAGGARRLVDPALFAGAERYHGGGMVLRPGEVPIIARRGERVIPAGQAGGAVQIVNVINETGAKVEQRRRRGPGGVQIVDVIVGEAARGMARGDFDQAMAVRFGLRPGRPA